MPTDPSRWEVMDDVMAEIMRQKSPAQSLAIADGLWRSARRLVRAQLKMDYPDWTDEQIDCETARRMSHGAV
jgi:hypothetical protein